MNDVSNTSPVILHAGKSQWCPSANAYRSHLKASLGCTRGLHHWEQPSANASREVGNQCLSSRPLQGVKAEARSKPPPRGPVD